MNFKFLVNTITDWNEPPRARHQLAEALSQDHQVTFVSANRFGFIPAIKTVSVSENLTVIIPHFPVDSRVRYRIPLINKIYQIWLFKRIRKEYNDYIVINFDFTALHIYNYFRRVVYYCNDDYIYISAINNPGFIVRYHRECEAAVARRAIFCVATSEFLAKKLTNNNRSTYELRLGAPKVKSIPANALKLSDKNNRPVNVGFVGYLNTAERELFEFLIEKRDIILTIVGPVSEQEAIKYKGIENVVTKGKLTGQDLYNAVADFDVGIVPYPLHSKVDRTPNKLWLYLALGKPVVISNIKSIENWKFSDGFVYRANNYEEFYAGIKKAHSENNETLLH